jgi:hypothetical protein
MVLPVSGKEPITAKGSVVQLNVVPATLLLKTIAVRSPEQTVAGEGLAVTSGIGFTVTVASIGNPGHPLAVGVMEYTASPDLFSTAVFNVCTMVSPEPASAPVTLV